MEVAMTFLINKRNDFFKEFDSMFKVLLTETGLGEPIDSAAQTNNAYVFSIELPGFRKEELSISALGKTITVTGTSARTKQSINKYFTGPKAINPKAVSARLEHGILEVTAPFLEDTGAAVKIEIT
jgi:HSP20 family protein